MSRHREPPTPTPRQRLRLSLIALAAAFAGVPAHALEFDTGNPDLTLRFDNTVKGSTMYRLHDAEPALVDSTRQLVPGVPASAFPQALNFNAGNDNFRKKGFVSKRLDLLSEFDAVYRKTAGLRVSAAAWYDHAYSGTSDATDRANGQNPTNQFPEFTKKLAGRKAEVLDAFVFGSVEVGEGRKLNAKLGRHALVYGESLFFGDNGIARAQGPVDVFKLLASPNAQFKEVIRPVPQISAQLQVSSAVSLGGYYQFRWEADRLAPAGSYFSTANNTWGGSPYPEIITTNVLLPGGDRKAKDSGQFGLQMKWRLEDTDLGFYVARFHDKSGVFYSQLNLANPTQGQWYFVFPESVKTVGASATRTIGDANFSVEGSLRTDMPLVNANIVYPNIAPAPQYATGKTAHVNVSWLATLPPSFLANETTFIGELAWNRVLSKTDPRNELDPIRTRDAMALQFIFSPAFRQALPGLDLSVPLGLRYVLDGNSAITGQGWGPRGTGSATLGLEGNYQGVWQFTLGYSHYIGRSEPFVDYTPLRTGGVPNYSRGNALADRDNVAFSLRRTF